MLESCLGLTAGTSFPLLGSLRRFYIKLFAISDFLLFQANKSVSLTAVVHLQWRASSILLWEHLPSCRDGTACPETEGYLRRDVTTLFW